MNMWRTYSRPKTGKDNIYIKNSLCGNLAEKGI
jgi:hypothetical protein